MVQKVYCSSEVEIAQLAPYTRRVSEATQGASEAAVRDGFGTWGMQGFPLFN